MKFPILIIWTNLFRILGFFGCKFLFHSNFKSTFCKQTVQNLTRRRVMRRLIWFFTVCRCPIRRTIGLNRLNSNLWKSKCVLSGNTVITYCRSANGILEKEHRKITATRHLGPELQCLLKVKQDLS